MGIKREGKGGGTEEAVVERDVLLGPFDGLPYIFINSGLPRLSSGLLGLLTR